MKSVLRTVGFILLSVLLLLSCGGDSERSDERVVEQGVQERRVITADNCGTEIATIGVGAGTPTPMSDVEQVDPPDYITKQVSLRTPWGTETYKYGLAETFVIRADFENIGSGSAPGNVDIKVHFYLSRGYKEDSHSDWIRVGEESIQSDNLRPGDEKTEFETVVIAQEIPGPGIWNIVACIDHPENDHNNGGDVREKHESNNCSTEAVFEVVDGTVNVPDIDLTVASFQLLQTPVYAGDFVRLGASIKNQGTMNALNEIRSSYTVSCNGGATTLLTDDATQASSLTAGATHWEEIITPVQMPNVVGTCTLTFTVDYQGVQTETDETNNTATLTVTLSPRPLPDLIITYIEIDDWPDRSIQKDKTHYPTMKIKNIGTGAVTSGIRSAYYFYGPSTGNVWKQIADDGTDAALLCVECEVTETINSGFKATKTGTHYLKACADYQNNQPESDESNNCLQSGPITVK